MDPSPPYLDRRHLTIHSQVLSPTYVFPGPSYWQGAPSYGHSACYGQAKSNVITHPIRTSHPARASTGSHYSFVNLQNGEHMACIRQEWISQLGARPSTRSHPHPLATAPVLYRCSAYGTRNIAMSTLNSVRGPTPADANPSTRGLIWIRAHTA